MTRTALYLAGGGARGAYQAGVLKAIHHILQLKSCPFVTISGVSVGSINASILAQHADDFGMGVEKMEMLWSTIHSHHVYNASNYAMSKSLLRNLSYFIVKHRNSGHLLDTKPLYDTIEKNIDFKQINKHIASGQLETVEILANCYDHQQTVSFYQHHQADFKDWHYPKHMSQRVELNAHHVLASSALPLFFPAVDINGFHFGDGSMGLVSPLRGALRSNVKKILIIGTRPLPNLANLEQWPHGSIGLAHILGSMLNGLFLDNLDRDIETVNHMNDIAQLLSVWKKHRSPWRPVETLHLRPSMDVATLAQNKYHNMPSLLRIFLNMLGAQNHSGDLLSFLLFEKEFAQELINLGYYDTLSNAPAIEAFFR